MKHRYLAGVATAFLAGVAWFAPRTARACTPLTCAAQGFSCGFRSDGCGGIIQCGSCPSGQTCGATSCGTGSCTPLTCASQGFACGPRSDGCGGIIQCRSCPSGQICEATSCFGPCTPSTCTALGKNCGTVADGCGGVLSCGSCSAPQTCGGSGVANVCGAPAAVPATPGPVTAGLAAILLALGASVGRSTWRRRPKRALRS